MLEAVLERYRAQTEGLIVDNDNRRQLATASIRDSDERRRDERLERRVCLGIVVFGALITGVLTIVGAGSESFGYHLASALGLAIGGGGLVQLNRVGNRR